MPVYCEVKWHHVSKMKPLLHSKDRFLGFWRRMGLRSFLIQISLSLQHRNIAPISTLNHRWITHRFLEETKNEELLFDGYQNTSSYRAKCSRNANERLAFCLVFFPFLCSANVSIPLSIIHVIKRMFYHLLTRFFFKIPLNLV